MKGRPGGVGAGRPASAPWQRLGCHVTGREADSWRGKAGGDVLRIQSAGHDLQSVVSSGINKVSREACAPEADEARCVGRALAENEPSTMRCYENWTSFAQNVFHFGSVPHSSDVNAVSLASGPCYQFHPSRDAVTRNCSFRLSWRCVSTHFLGNHPYPVI